LKTSKEILGFLKTQGVEISLLVEGSGTKAILSFPGIGMKESYFNKWLRGFSNEYLKLNFSIVCHKEYDAKAFLNQWNDLLKALEYEYGIEEWNAIAYSIGSRWLFYSKLAFKKVVLIAPDGIVEGIVYRLVVSTRLFKKLFFTFSTYGIKVFKKYLPSFLLNEIQVYNQWKLFMLNKFPDFKGDNVAVFLAKNDWLIQSKSVRLKLSKYLGYEVFMLDSDHFDVLKGAKGDKNIF